MVDLSSMSDADLMRALAASCGQSAPSDGSGVTLTMGNPGNAAPPQPAAQQTNAPADYGPPMPDQQSVPMPVSSSGFSLSTQPPAPRQADQSQAAPSGKSPSEMSDAELMTALAQSRQRDQGGIVRNVGAGADQALYDTLGAPVDLANWALGHLVQNPFSHDPAQPLSAEPFGGSKSIARGFNSAGVPDPESIPANTTGEKVARGVGAGAGFAIAPEAVLAGLARAGIVGPQATEALGHIFGKAESLPSMAGNAVAGATGGGTAAAAEEAVPDKYKPLAGTIGGLIGGAAGAAAAATPRAVGTGMRVVGEALDPLTAGGQQRAAGRILSQASSNPAALKDDLANLPTPAVPGYEPTTFQATGDMGLGVLERGVAAKNPAEFAQRRADQNSKLLDDLGNLQSSGHPEAVANAVRSRLADIDAQTNTDLYNALADASARAEALGGAGTPDAYGASLRDALRGAENASRENERALWNAVDPDGTLTTGASNLAGTAKSVLRGMSDMAAPMEPAEAAIFNKSATAPQTVKFSDLIAMRSRVSDALRNELFTNGQTAAYRRLSQLRSAIEDDVNGVVAKRAADDAKAVAAGQLSPEDAMVARLQQKWADEIAGTRANARGQSAGAGGSTFGYSARGASGFGSSVGTAGQTAERPFRPSDASGISEAPLSPTFDEAARGRLNVATNATRERAQTFDATPNDRILRREGQNGPYDLPVSAVPGQIFFPGPKSFDAIQSFRRAVGDGPALATLQDYAAQQLRRAATQPDGTLKPQVITNWRRAHADALRAFPELDARFADAGRAAETMQVAAGTRRQALDDYQRGIVGKLVGVTDPSDVTRVVGSVFNRQDSVAQMQRLAAEAARTSDGKSGLRKAIADFMMQNLISNTEAATSGRTLIKQDRFQTFVKRNRAALRTVFNDQDLDRIGRIADALQQGNRSITAARIPGGSNTTQDLFAAAKGDSNATILAKIVAKAGAAGLGTMAATNPAVGLAATIGTGTVLALREAGIRKIDDLVRDAMLDPSTANLLLMKAPPKGDTGPYIALAQRLRRGALAGEAASASDSPPPAAPPPPPPPARRSALDTILSMGAG